MNKSRKAFATCAVSAALLGQNFLFSQNVLAASDSMYLMLIVVHIIPTIYLLNADLKDNVLGLPMEGL